MDCRVCNGSGVSPASRTRAARRLGFIVECGACGGTGIARRQPRPEPEPAPEPEPESAGTGALDAAAAFQRHYDSIFGLQRDAGGEDYASMHGIALFSACCRIDGRYAAELPNTAAGRTTRETVDNLESIVADYRRLAPEAHRAVLLQPDALDKKIADALKSLACARDHLGEIGAAQRGYDEAREIYVRLGELDEARSCSDAAMRLRLRVGGDVDLALEALHARADEAPAPLDFAESQIELAELHLSRNDDFEAETYLRRAEAELEPLARQASGTATADALVRSLTEAMGGGMQGQGMGIEDTVRLRTLLSRLYRGLARVAPDQARDYLDRLTQLEGSIDEGSRDNAEFSQRMLSSLDGLLEQLDRRRDEP